MCADLPRPPGPDRPLPRRRHRLIETVPQLPPTVRLWVAPTLSGAAAVRPAGQVTLVFVFGRLDEAALQPCRAALSAALPYGRPILLDLARTDRPVRGTVPLLSAMHRYVRARGVDLTLVGVPARLRYALQRAGVATGFDLAGRLQAADPAVRPVA